MLLAAAGWLVAFSPSFLSAQDETADGSLFLAPYDDAAADEFAEGSTVDFQTNSHLRDRLRQLMEKQRVALENSRFDTVGGLRQDDESGDEDYDGHEGTDSDKDEIDIDDDMDDDDEAEDDRTVTSRNRRISEIRPSLDYAWGDIDADDLPEDFDTSAEDSFFARPVPYTLIYQWRAVDLWYHPIYFEDPTLERYGHTYHPVVQPVVSTGRFVTQTVMWPYHANLRPVHSREYPLGYYRPGECAPKLTYQVPFNEEAAVTETLAVMGLFFLIP